MCLLFTIILRLVGACRGFYEFLSVLGGGAGPSEDDGLVARGSKWKVASRVFGIAREVCRADRVSVREVRSQRATGAAGLTQATAGATRAAPR